MELMKVWKLRTLGRKKMRETWKGVFVPTRRHPAHPILLFILIPRVVQELWPQLTRQRQGGRERAEIPETLNLM